MSDLKKREVERFTFPLPKNFKPKHPETFNLFFEKGFSIDLGALCYLERGNAVQSYKNGRYVDETSFSQPRANDIAKLIQTLVDYNNFSPLRPRTIFAQFQTVVFFMDWCDSRNIKVLESKELTKQALQKYIDDLKSKVNQSQLKQQTAKGYTRPLIGIFEHMFNDENFGQGINKISIKNHISESTKVPDSGDQEKVLAWAKCIFRGFTELVLDQKAYPYSLSVPSYLNWPDNRIWVFPVYTAWCCPPGREERLKRRHLAYDFKNGAIRTLEEVMAISKINSKSKKNSAMMLVELANMYLRRSNEDLWSKNRLQKGMLAMNAFIVMFYANTGVNTSQLTEMPWSEELEEAVNNPSAERYGFKSIKYRANNRIVHFEVGVEFLPLLRRFLLLRKYLLRGQKFDYLFFTFGNVTNLELKPEITSDRNYRSFYKTIRNILPGFPIITPSQWRAAKQDYLIRNHDPATASLVMQHTVETAIKHYSNGSVEVQREELDAYFKAVKQIVIDKKGGGDSTQVTPIGLCSSPNQPNPNSSGVIFQQELLPDCKTPEGCLFCDKYRVHADEIDIRKLLSARYFLKKLSVFGESDMQYKSYLSSVINKVDEILSELKNRDFDLFNKLEIDAEDGQLDTFWNAKLQMLIELDVI